VIRLFKILTVIFSLVVIIPNEKLAFPSGIIVLLNFLNGEFLGIILGLTFLLVTLYLLDSAFSKYNNKLDDLIVIGIIAYYYLLMLLCIINMYKHGDFITWASTCLFISVSLPTLVISILKLKKR